MTDGIDSTLTVTTMINDRRSFFSLTHTPRVVAIWIGCALINRPLEGRNQKIFKLVKHCRRRRGSPTSPTLFGALRYGLFGGDIRNVPCQLDFVTGDLAFVNDAERRTFEGEILDKANLVAADGSFLDVGVRVLRLHVTGQLVAFDLEC